MMPSAGKKPNTAVPKKQSTRTEALRAANRVTFGRDPQGRITSVTDPMGQQVKYRYDQNGDLVSVTDRANNTTQFVYRSTPGHYLDQVIDPLGRTGVRSEYDDQGRLNKLVDPSGNPVQLAYDPTHSLEVITDQLGNKLTLEYDDRGNTVRQIDALGGVTHRTFDADNNMLTETDPLGRTTSFTYDDRGNVLTQTDPLGNTTHSTYEEFTLAVTPFTRIKTSTDPLGNTVVNSYDRRGNLVSAVDPPSRSSVIRGWPPRGPSAHARFPLRRALRHDKFFHPPPDCRRRRCPR